MSLGREFPVGVVYSLATGRAFCAFGAVHEAAEYLLGSPIWTHQFADQSVWDRMAVAIAEQHPQIASFVIGECPDRTDDAAAARWMQAEMGRLAATIGRDAVLLVPVGDWEPLSPLDLIPEGKEVIVVEADPAAGEEGLRHAADQVKRIIRRDKEAEDGGDT